jgi:pyrroloquinoline-quinone synthase
MDTEGEYMKLDDDEFRSQLENTLHAHLTISHPIFALLLDAENPRLDFLQLVALQGYQLTKNFLEYVENLFFYCPIPRHKRRLLHNLYEEETGRISKTKNHVKLMQEFLRALGIDDETRDAAVALPNTRELIDYRMAAVKDPSRYHVGAAAVTIASEGQNLETLGSESRDVLFARVYDLKPKDLLFFSVHQIEDVGHTQQGLDLVVDLCTTGQLQEEAVFAVEHTCELFYQMYEGIYREYTAGRLLPA